MPRPKPFVEQVLDPGQLRRIRADWVDPDRTMLEMIKRYQRSQKTIEKLCADLPPRRLPERLKRQAPHGLRGML